MATSRRQEVQGAGRGNVKSKSRSRVKLIDGIDEDPRTAGPMCGLKPSVQEISVEVRGQLAFPPGAALSSSILLAVSSAHPCSSSASCHDGVPSAK